MAKRSVYFGEPIDRLLSLVGTDNVSGALNGAVARYLSLTDEYRPELSRAQWCAICDALNGTMLDNLWIRRGGRMIAMELEDSPGLGEKWEIDLPALIAEMEALSTVESIAVLHVVETFWAHSEMDTDEALALAGVK